MLKVRIGTMVLGFAAAAGLMLALERSAIGQAAGENDIKKIAALIKKGDMVGAKKAAEAAHKGIEIDEVMYLYKPAKKKGIGVTGSDQGIEQALIAIARDLTAGKLTKMAEAYEEMGYNIAALGLITEHKVPAKDVGKMTKKAWIESTTGTVETGIKLAEAAKAKNAKEVMAQAVKVNNNCNNCHTIFR